MKKFSRIFLILTVVLLLSWQIPQWYSFFAAQPAKTPFTLYSCICGDFIGIVPNGDRGVVRRDRAGHVYTQEQADSLLPFFNMRQLVADNRFPDSICGVAVTPHDVQRTSFSFRSSPSDINAPSTGLYPLLESLSGRVDLTMPDDVFRITCSGIEFVTTADNSTDRQKSRRFTEAMEKKGFRFPASRIAGNPTTRKEYDNGYLMLDADGRLFHIRQNAGRPYVRAIELPQGVRIRHPFLTEFRDRRILGLLSADDGSLLVLRDTYEILPTALPAIDPERDGFSIFGNMLDWTVCVKSDRSDAYYALRADDYSMIDSVVYAVDRRPAPGLRFTSPNDKFVRPRVF